jgi:hypothetical protein
MLGAPFRRRYRSCFASRLSVMSMVFVGLLAGVPAGATAAAKYQTGTYKGQTNQSHLITVGADGREVRGLDTVVFAFCLFPGDARHELHRVRPTGVISIHSGKFAASNVPLFDGGSATIRGKLSASKGSGSIDVAYTELELQGATQVLGTCNGSLKWSARWKHRSYPPGPPKTKPPARPAATFTGHNADSQAVSFQTSASGAAVSHIATTYSYTCISGASGQLDFNSGSQDDAINPATGFFNYTADAPVAGLTDSAHFSFSGSIDSSGRAATGVMQVSFSTTGGDSCVGDNASWSAHT